MHWQVRWLEYLSQFNLVICFCPGCLSTKPDALTRQWDVYPKGGDNVMNIEWDYSYYQPWSDNEWLVDEMIAMQEEVLMAQNEDITMQ